MCDRENPVEKLKSLDEAASRPELLQKEKTGTQWLDVVCRTDTNLEITANVHNETKTYLFFIVYGKQIISLVY